MSDSQHLKRFSTFGITLPLLAVLCIVASSTIPALQNFAVFFWIAAGLLFMATLVLVLRNAIRSKHN